jgi:predicted CoA-binding protein
MRVIVLGASDNPARYSFMAMNSLMNHGHDAIPVGIKKAEINGIQIINTREILPDIHTITLYVNPLRQKDWYDYILQTKPQRIIFNPGTENPELMELAAKNNIEVIEACTLVMLSTDQFD